MSSPANLSVNYHLHISDGRSQAKRLLPALERDYFNLADMHFHTLLAMVVDYVQVMKFYNLNNQEDGAWDQFFSVDETIVIATILALDLNKLMTSTVYKTYATDASDELFKALRAVPSKEIGQHMISAYSAISMLDNWLQLLAMSQNQVGAELRKVLESVIIGLKKDIDILGQYLTGYLSHKRVEEIFSRDLIALAFAPAEGNPLKHADSAVDVRDKAPIRSCFYAFIKAIEMVQVSAAKLLPVSLVSSDHDPADRKSVV